MFLVQALFPASAWRTSRMSSFMTVRASAATALRFLCAATLALVTAIASANAADQDYWESGWDRPGNDYKPPIELEFKQGTFLTFEMECQGLCERDGRCKAWTMVKPGVQGPKARCYLKDPVPAQRRNACCVSGIAKRARPQLSPEEVADRDPRGKTLQQCDAAYQRNVARCSSRGIPHYACLPEYTQIRAACMSLAAQAAGGGTTPTPSGGGGSSTILNYAKNAFGKCVDRDLKVRSAACPSLPVGQVGHGECTDLVNGAVVSAGFSKISGYVWGTKVGDNNTANKSVFQPGDIIQLFNYKLVNPANTGNYSESSSQHSAIIESNNGGVLTVLEQNTNWNGENRRYVTRGTYNLNWRLERGNYIVYRK